MTELSKTTTCPKRPRRMARVPKADAAARQAPAEGSEPSDRKKSAELSSRAIKPQTKSELILGLLQREEAATLEQLIAATGWLPHTTRAALTGLKKKGHEVTSAKTNGMRVYRVIKPQRALPTVPKEPESEIEA